MGGRRLRKAASRCAASALRRPSLVHPGIRLRPDHLIVSRTRAICALIESGPRVSTRKPLREAQPIAFGTAVQVFPGYTRGTCGEVVNKPVDNRPPNADNYPLSVDQFVDSGKT